MATYSVTITEQRRTDGNTAGREAYNADIPIDAPDSFSTCDEYVQFVMGQASESYANRHGL